MTDQLGDGPIEALWRDRMIQAMRALDEEFNPGLHGKDKKIGMILLLFPYGGADGRCNYISNGADRRDVIVLLKEQLARFEGQAEATGHG